MSGAAAANEHLCVSCGICCGGALFDQAKLTPAEAPRMRELGFAVELRGEQAVIRLPCGNLRGTVCQVYESRPDTCRTYRCATLRAVDCDEIDRSEADRRVAAAKAAIADVRQRLLPGETFLELRQRFGNDPSPPPGFRLAMVVYDMMLDRYFRRPHQRVLTP